MASKRALRRRACDGKQRYADRAAAVTACTIQTRRSRKYLHPYRCPHCSDYHIGHYRSGLRPALL